MKFLKEVELLHYFVNAVLANVIAKTDIEHAEGTLVLANDAQERIGNRTNSVDVEFG